MALTSLTVAGPRLVVAAGGSRGGFDAFQPNFSERPEGSQSANKATYTRPGFIPRGSPVSQSQKQFIM